MSSMRMTPRARTWKMPSSSESSKGMPNLEGNTILRAPAAADRVARAEEWLEARRGRSLLVIASTLGAARQLLRRAAARAGAGFGWQPATLARLAAGWAGPALAAR